MKTLTTKVAKVQAKIAKNFECRSCHWKSIKFPLLFKGGVAMLQCGWGCPPKTSWSKIIIF